MPLPTVAIVGRPNVGKSTLFNRLGGKKLAVVGGRPGVTRDRREGEARLLGLDFRVIDTAGYEDEDPQTLPGRMRAQTSAAVRDAERAPFMLHGGAGRRSSPPQTGAGAGRARPFCSRPGRWAWASRSRSAPSMAKASPTCSSS